MTAGEFIPDGTIVAWAGASSPSALGIVRLSGPDSHRIAAALTRKVPDPESWAGNRPQAFLTKLFHPESPKSIIETCVSIWYRAPHSYTGEDMVEFSIHGNPILASEVVDACVAQGARLAAPGEFTERAFLNGKLDLTQAEAVQELIASKTRRELETARSMLLGGLRKKIEAWYESLTRLRASLEVVFDYPGGISDVSWPTVPSPDGHRQFAAAPPEEEAEREAMSESLEKISGEMSEIVRYYDRNKSIREGVRVAITGAPNAGKSSLFNALAGFDRALTDAEPGTTRDYLELTLGWEHLTITLVDTAGLRTDAGRVEMEGVHRARRILSEADVVVFLVDSTRGLAPDAAAAEAPEMPEGRKLLVALSKSDLLSKKKRAEFAKKFTGTGAIAGNKPHVVFLASAKTGEGITEIKEWLSANLAPEETGDRLLVSERHRDEIIRAATALSRARESLRQGVPSDLVVIDIADAIRALGAITGREPADDLLDAIFSGFCVGK